MYTNGLLILIVYSLFSFTNEQTLEKSFLDITVMDLLDTIPPLLLGDTYEDENGEQFSFTSVKGKILLLDFWATWCGPCIRDHPFVEAIKKEINSDEFQVISISIDRDIDKWKNFLLENEWDSINIILDHAKPNDPVNQLVVEEFMKDGKKMQKTAVPQYFLVDEMGSIEKIEDIKSKVVLEKINLLLNK